SVIAPTATEADAFSTAFSMLPASRIREIVAARPNIQVHLTDANGKTLVHGT
ncbi:MAG TPA: FAD:protein FMN transferase, partial [Hyphomicrobium sp.]|nr:FAD:protein FMN transferase [Hyphomicrobium sp.]